MNVRLHANVREFIEGMRRAKRALDEANEEGECDG